MKIDYTTLECDSNAIVCTLRLPDGRGARGYSFTGSREEAYADALRKLGALG